AADPLRELRSRIHRAKTGACLTPVAVRRLYDDPVAESVNCATLSHIVSCPTCLDLVTAHLILGPYADRDPRDMLGPDGGWRTIGIAIVAATMLTVWATLPWPGRTASASELLRAARVAEHALLAVPNVVVHRVLTMEERGPAARHVVKRARVEIWRDGARGVAVRRLYDDQNRVAAGEWTSAAGAR